MRPCHDGKGEIQLSDASQFACSDGKTKGDIPGKCRERILSVNFTIIMVFSG